MGKIMKSPTDGPREDRSRRHAADLQEQRQAHQHRPRRCGRCENCLCHGAPPVRRPRHLDHARQFPDERASMTTAIVTLSRDP